MCRNVTNYIIMYTEKMLDNIKNLKTFLLQARLYMEIESQRVKRL
jgi:hypothetical protein